MSAETLALAFGLELSNRGKKLLLMAFSESCDSRGYCPKIGIAELAKKSGYQQRAIYYYTQELIKEGWLEWLQPLLRVNVERLRLTKTEIETSDDLDVQEDLVKHKTPSNSDTLPKPEAVLQNNLSKQEMQGSQIMLSPAEQAEEISPKLKKAKEAFRADGQVFFQKNEKVQKNSSLASHVHAPSEEEFSLENSDEEEEGKSYNKSEDPSIHHPTRNHRNNSQNHKALQPTLFSGFREQGLGGKERGGKEGEFEGEPSEGRTIGTLKATSPKKASVAPGTVQKPSIAALNRAVFEAWTATNPSRSPENLRLNAARCAKIQARRHEGYTEQEMIWAAKGWIYDDWEDRPKHNDLAILLRNGTYLEKFRDLYLKNNPKEDPSYSEQEPEDFPQKPMVYVHGYGLWTGHRFHAGLKVFLDPKDWEEWVENGKEKHFDQEDMMYEVKPRMLDLLTPEEKALASY